MVVMVKRLNCLNIDENVLWKKELCSIFYNANESVLSNFLIEKIIVSWK